MDFYRRGQTLCRLIEQTINIEAFTSDIALVSRMRGTSILPIGAFVGHQLFSRFRITENDIINACEQSTELKGRMVYCPDACLVLPFFVDPKVLIVSNLPDAKQAEFRSFVALLLGHKYFEVHPNPKPNSFKTRFADTNTAFAVWRALNYCAFKGSILTAAPLASLVPIEQLEELKPIPVHKKRENKTQRKRKQRIKNAKKVELPAVVPMAAAILGGNQVPQAVCLGQR